MFLWRERGWWWWWCKSFSVFFCLRRRVPISEYQVHIFFGQVGDGEEGGGVVLGDFPWSQTVLDLATDVLAEFNGDLAIFAFKVFKESGVIRVRLDKLSDK